MNAGKEALLREKYLDIYEVTFRKRPLGMLVEDREGITTVVELQNEDDGLPGQAELNGVRVKDGIVSIQVRTVLHQDFQTITAMIRHAEIPLAIGFARHRDNHQEIPPPLPRQPHIPPPLPPPSLPPAPAMDHYLHQPLHPAHHHFHQQQQHQHHHESSSIAGMKRVDSGGGMVEMEEEHNRGHSNGGGGDPNKRMRRTTSGNSNQDMVVLPPPPPTAAQMAAAAIGVGGSASRAEGGGGGEGHYPLPPQHHHFPPPPPPHHSQHHHQVHHAAVSRSSNEEKEIASFLRASVNMNPEDIDGMLEQLGRRALYDFGRVDEEVVVQAKESPQQQENVAEKNGDGVGEKGKKHEGGSGEKEKEKKSADKQQQEQTAGAFSSQLSQTGLNPDAANAIQKLKDHYVRVRNLRLENRMATSEINEYCRAMLERAHSLAYIENQVSELLTQRVLAVREGTLELRRSNPETDKQPLAAKWTLVNEQRKNHLHSRQIVNRTLTELEHLVTEAVPFISKSIDHELQRRLHSLDKTMSEFHYLEVVVREVINSGGGPKLPRQTGGGRGGTALQQTTQQAEEGVSAGAGKGGGGDKSTLIRPSLFTGSGSGGLDGGGGSAEKGGGRGGGRSSAPSTPRVHYKRKPVHLGTAYQLPDSSLPSAYALDRSFELSNRPLLTRDGEEGCRWKPPPSAAKSMPSDEEIQAFVEQFPAKYEEQVLWELYKVGWEMSVARLKLSTMMNANQLVSREETALRHEPFSQRDIQAFEVAMSEKWKDFYHASVDAAQKKYEELYCLLLQPLEENGGLSTD